MENNEAKPEQASGKAKKLAQKIWKEPMERIKEELKKPENASLLKQIKENPKIFTSICRKINGIRFDQRNKKLTTLKDIPISESAVLDFLACEQQEERAMNNVVRTEKPDEKMTEIRKRREEKKNHANRGVIISLLKATDKRPLKTPRVKKVEKEDDEYLVRTSIFAGMRHPIGIDISTEGVKISEANDIITLHMEDLKITGVPAGEISDGKLRGLFFLDVVKIEHSNKRDFALYPKLTFIEHLNGTKPVFKATINKEMIKSPGDGSYHTTPSKNGYMLHLEPTIEIETPAQ